MQEERLQRLLELFPEFVGDCQLEGLSNPPKLEQKRATCGAQTRRKLPCQRKALAYGRCPNHGGLSSGPKTAEDQIIGDCIAYIRTSRKPLGSRLLCATRDMFRRLAKETSIIFRATVLIAISVRPSDLTALREELGLRVTSNIERLEILERYSRAGARVVADATASVAFIQGAYGLREIASGRMLHQVVGSDGIPLTTPRGQPLLSLEGDGPVAEIQFTGTGFFSP